MSFVISLDILCMMSCDLTDCTVGYRRVKKRRYLSTFLRRKGILAKVSGSGAYYLNGRKIPSGQGVPQFGKSHGSCIISHREYVTDIQTSAADGKSFNAQTFYLNPGLSQAEGSPFPWLAGVGSEFEEYKLLGCIFEFRTTSATFVGGSTSSALGQIIMATQYNSAAPPFTEKASMEQYQGAVSGVVSRDIIHGVECKKTLTPIPELYVRTGPVPSGQDQRLYDFAQFTIATQGGTNPASTTVGELWVTYRVKLMKPKIGPAENGNDINSDHFQLPYVMLCFVCVL